MSLKICMWNMWGCEIVIWINSLIKRFQIGNTLTDTNFEVKWMVFYHQLFYLKIISVYRLSKNWKWEIIRFSSLNVRFQIYLNYEKKILKLPENDFTIQENDWKKSKLEITILFSQTWTIKLIHSLSSIVSADRENNKEW
jgi:hypothetical protein